jgi:hypothetical protein
MPTSGLCGNFNPPGHGTYFARAPAKGKRIRSGLKLRLNALDKALNFVIF